MSERVNQITFFDITERPRSFEYQRYIDLQQFLRRKRKEAVIFCQHPPTITAGIESQPQNLFTTPEKLMPAGIDFLKLSRAGDHTAHEPGQCVIYIHLDLQQRRIGLKDYFNSVLQITAAAIDKTWQLKTNNRSDAPGLYLEPTADQDENWKKVTSIGVELKQFFSSYGLAINIDNDLSTFTHIRPCGLDGVEVTSLKKEAKDPSRLPEFKRNWKNAFQLWLTGEELQGKR